LKEAKKVLLSSNRYHQLSEVLTILSPNTSSSIVPEWIVDTYASRNWVEFFNREAKKRLARTKEYQVRDKEV